MNRPLLIVAAGAGLGFFAWWYVSQQGAQASAEPVDLVDQPEPSLIEDTMSTIDNLMTDVRKAVDDPQVQAFLALIRAGEGTAGPNGYRTLFGGALFDSYADHPRRTVMSGAYTSTAAGAYQILSRTWDEMKAKYTLLDFSPWNQDVAAVGLIKRRGALADVLAGRFKAAIDKCNKEWASLPGSPYGQPTLSYARAQDVLLAAGGQILGTVA